MLEWLIIGGGVHGTYLSRVLTREAGVASSGVRVLDPWEEPLSRFLACAAATGMGHLRSSLVHHLDAEPMSLRRFATERGGVEDDLVGPYLRPSVEVFRAHCKDVVARNGLDTLRVVGEATGLERNGRGYHIDTTSGRLEARRVVLAMGGMGEPSFPEWALDLRACGLVRHVFEPGFARAQMRGWQSVAVVGGGLSAIQVALALADELPSAVTLIARHGRRVHDFDTDSGWMGPKLDRGFHRETDRDGRRRIIAGARHRGSAPQEVAARLGRRVADGDLMDRRAEVAAARLEGDRAVLVLSDGKEISVDGVLLATGFRSGRPGGPWLDRAIAQLELQYAACGYPVVDESLCWAPGIYVTGPLAELEIGPTAHDSRERGCSS